MFQLLKNPSFDFMSKRSVMLAVSGVMVVVAIALMASRGLNPGIEFTGGTEIQIRLESDPDVGAVRSALSAAGFGGSIVTTIGDPVDREIYIKLQGQDEEKDDLAKAVTDALRTGLGGQGFELRSQTHIGPAIGGELQAKAIRAIIGSLIGMLLYIWIRFQLQWGFAAVVALFHDTIITLGLFSLFGLEMNLSVVAAFLTLVGYSVNDTVVIFDRIRENLRTRQGSSLQDTINLAINQTLARTVITSGLTWIVVFGLYLFGGGALKPFAFVLSAGVVVGTYSSIFIAAPVLLFWQRLFGDGKKAAKPVAAA